MYPAEQYFLTAGNQQGVAADPAPAPQRITGVRRIEIAQLIAAALGANYTLDYFLRFGGAGIGLGAQSISALESINVFQIFAWYAAFALLQASDRIRPASPGDLAIVYFIASGMLGANLFADRTVFAVLATIAALYLCLNHRGDLNFKAAGAVFLAIAANGVWGPLFFSYSADEFLWADSRITGAVLHFLRPDIEWSALAIRAPDGHRIVVIDQCSSFHNMTLAILCAVSMIMLRRHTWRQSDIYVIAILCVTMFLMNAARIFAMALGKANYIYWHDGPGAMIFGAAVTLVIFAVCFVALRCTEPKT